MSEELHPLDEIRQQVVILNAVVRRIDTAKGLTAENIPGLLTYIDDLLAQIASLEHQRDCPLCKESGGCVYEQQAREEVGVTPGFLDEFFGPKYLPWTKTGEEPTSPDSSDRNP